MDREIIDLVSSEDDNEHEGIFPDFTPIDQNYPEVIDHTVNDDELENKDKSEDEDHLEYDSSEFSSGYESEEEEEEQDFKLDTKTFHIVNKNGFHNVQYKSRTKQQKSIDRKWYSNFSQNDQASEFLIFLQSLTCSSRAKINVGVNLEMYPRNKHQTLTFDPSQKVSFHRDAAFDTVARAAGRIIYNDWNSNNFSVEMLEDPDMREYVDPVVLINKLIRKCLKLPGGSRTWFLNTNDVDSKFVPQPPANLRYPGQPGNFCVHLLLHFYKRSEEQHESGVNHSNLLVFSYDGFNKVKVYRIEPYGISNLPLLDEFLQDMIRQVDDENDDVIIKFQGNVSKTCPIYQPQMTTSDNFCILHSLFLAFLVVINPGKSLKKIINYFYGKSKVDTKADLIIFGNYVAELFNKYYEEQIMSTLFE